VSDPHFRPVVYLKKACPFSLKVRLFLLESGLIDKVDVREAAPDSAEDKAIRSELAPHFDKVTFPSAQVAPGTYMSDSDAIVARFAEMVAADPDHLPTLKMYKDGAFQQLMTLYKENAELKKRG
jgi:hypothetical protein